MSEEVRKGVPFAGHRQAPQYSGPCFGGERLYTARKGVESILFVSRVRKLSRLIPGARPCRGKGRWNTSDRRRTQTTEMEPLGAVESNLGDLSSGWP